MIVLDAWRFDMLNSQVTPNIARFAKNAWVFNNNLAAEFYTTWYIFLFIVFRKITGQR